MLREAAYIPAPSYGILDGGPSQTEMLKKKEAEVKKKRDDDIYYLLT
jgi:hypothetical protein